MILPPHKWSSPFKDVLDVPPPDYLGNAVVRFNGRVVERAVYSDAGDDVTTEDGRKFTADEWAKYLVKQATTNGWEKAQ
jgi:hypothetical protein